MASALQLLSNLSSPVSILKGGTALQTRPRINIIEGSNVTIVATDDSVNYKTDITINSAGSGSGGTVTSVDGSGGTTGLTVTGGPITTTGTLTLGGTLGVANGGTGKTTFSTAGYVKANGTTALTSVSSIPGTDITGDISGTASNVTGIVAVVNGGTGSNSASTARTALGLAIGTDVLAPNGSAAALTSFPTLNQNTTGTASNVTGTVAIANGGTGQTTRQNALNALGGAVTSGYYLRGDGTNLSLSALSATDFTTGTLAVSYGGTGTTSYTAGYVKASGTSAFTTVSSVPGSDVSGNIAGTSSNVSGIVAISHGGTGAFSAAGAISNLGLGTLATQNGVFSGVSSGTNTGDQTLPTLSSLGGAALSGATFTGAISATNLTGTNTGDQTITLTGDATGSGTGSFAVTVGKINGTALSGLATGILKNTTTTGVPSIAVAGDFPTLNQNTSGSSASCTGNAATATALATARAINGTNFDGTAAISISATATGTGAVARTINNRASDVFNVKDYGAVGDGSTNDTSSIQAAADALRAVGRGTLYFPDGRYVVAGIITLGDGRTYNGSGGLPYNANFTVKGNGINSSVIIQTSNNASNPTLYINVDNTNVGSVGVRRARSKCEVFELGFRTSSGTSSNAAIKVLSSSDGSSETVGPVSIHNIDIGFDDFSGTTGGWVYGIRIENPWKVVLHNIFGCGTNNNAITIISGSCGNGSNGAGSGALIDLIGGTNVMMTNIYASFFQQGIRQLPFTTTVDGITSLAAQGYNISNFQTVAVIESLHIYPGKYPSAINLSNFLFDQGNAVNNSLPNYGVIIDCNVADNNYFRGQVVIMNGNVTMGTTGTVTVFLLKNVCDAIISGVISYIGPTPAPFALLQNSSNSCMLMNNQMGSGAITVDAGCAYVYVNNTQTAGTLTGFGGTVVNLATPF